MYLFKHSVGQEIEGTTGNCHMPVLPIAQFVKITPCCSFKEFQLGKIFPCCIVVTVIFQDIHESDELRGECDGVVLYVASINANVCPHTSEVK